MAIISLRDNVQNGLLTFQEIRQVLTEFNIDVTDADFESLMLLYDLNRDKMISYQEFVSQFGKVFHAATEGDYLLNALDDKGVIKPTGKGQVTPQRIEMVHRCHEMTALQAQVLLDQKMLSQWTNLNALLMKIARNNFGFIKRSEFRRFLSRLNIDSSDKEFDKLIAMYDDTESQKGLEYTKFLKRFNALLFPNTQEDSLATVLLLEQPVIQPQESQGTQEDLVEYLKTQPEEAWIHLYHEFDKKDMTCSRWVSKDIFDTIMKAAMPWLNQQDFMYLTEICGCNTNELLNYKTLIETVCPTFKPMDAAAREREYLESHCNAMDFAMIIYSNRLRLSEDDWNKLSLRFKKNDLQQTGFISRDLFIHDLVHGPLALTQEQAIYAVYAFEHPKDHSLVDYRKFTRHYSLKQPTEVVIDRPIVSVEKKFVLSEPEPVVNQEQLQQYKAALSSKIKEIEAECKQQDTEMKGVIGILNWKAILQKLGVQDEEAACFDRVFAPFKRNNGRQIDYRSFLVDGTATIVPLSDGGSSIVDIEPKPIGVLTDFEFRAKLKHLATFKYKKVVHWFQALDPDDLGELSYPEIRRVFDRLGLILSDRDFQNFITEYDVDENQTVKYFQLLHAFGGKDPSSMSKFSDIGSSCSYFSSISISPQRSGLKASPRVTKDVMNIGKACASAVEQRHRIVRTRGVAKVAEQELEKLLEKKWKTVNQALKKEDAEHTGLISPAAFLRVLDSFGMSLDPEQLNELRLKYDVASTGSLAYPQLLQQLVNSNRKQGGYDKVASMSQQIKLQWKSIYTSMKQLDKSKSGRIRTQHFRQLLEWYGFVLSDSDFYNLLKTCDSTCDGQIDYHHFVKQCLAAN